MISHQANLLQNLEKMREDHIKYACELSRWRTLNVPFVPFVSPRYSPEVTSTFRSDAGVPGTDADNKLLMEMGFRGLRLLSEWTSAVTEFYSWKLLHPTDNLHNKDCPPVRPLLFSADGMGKICVLVLPSDQILLNMIKLFAENRRPQHEFKRGSG